MVRELHFERLFRESVERDGMRWERASYSRADAGGRTLGYRIAPHRVRGIALLVHGAGNDALFGMVALARALLRDGLEIFTFDLDGHGRAGETTLGAESVSGAVPAAMAAALAGRTLPLYAVGISLGGSLLLHALPFLRPRPAAAVLICAPLRIEMSAASILAEVRPGLAAVLWRGRREYGATGLIPSFGRFKRQSYPLRLAEAPPAGSFGYVDVLNRILGSLRLEDAARGVDLPVRLIYGSADRLVPPRQASRLAALLPRSELLLLGGESHLTTPLDPRALAATVEWFA